MLKKIFAGLLALTLLVAVSGCSSTAPSASASLLTADGVFFTNEYSYSEEDTTAEYTDITATITLSDQGVTISGKGATASGSFVEINSGGTFVLSGKLSNGQIAVNAPAAAQVRLILNGVDITSGKSAPIYCMQADKLIVTLAESTQNTLTDAENYTYVDATSEEPDAALFSKKDLSINGSGTLTINANFNNGIGTKDDLVIAGGTINISSANNAIRGRDSVVILDGNFNLSSQNDGIQSNNDEDVSKGGIIITGGIFNITSAHDAIQAETTIKISGGEFLLVSGGGNAVFHEEVVETAELSNSYKAIKAGGNFVITGGVFDIDSSDDSLHTNANMQFLGGEFSLSSGDDGIHADENLLISDGDITILTSYEGLEAKVITIDGARTSIVASDDGINASDSAASASEVVRPGGGGTPPADGGTPPADGGTPPAGGGTPPTGAGAGGGGTALNNGVELYINGGVLYIDAGADAIDSNGNVKMTGGEVYINGPTAGGNGALDADGTFDITGGIIIGTESSDGSSPSTSSTQPSFVLYFSELKTSGSVITIETADKEQLATFTPSKDFSILLFSAPTLNLNETYTIYLDKVKIADITLEGITTIISDAGEAVNQRRP